MFDTKLTKYLGMDEILESVYGKIYPVFDEKMNILVRNIHFLKHNEYTPSRPRLTDWKKRDGECQTHLTFTNILHALFC